MTRARQALKAERRRAYRKVYNSARWKRMRADVLRESPLCVECEGQGRVTAATVVDHLVPHRGDKELAFDRSNLRAVCKRCHDQKTARHDNGQAFGAFQRIPSFCRPSAVPVHLVCGPPASGKSTLVERRAAEDAVIIDLDQIAAEVSGQPFQTCDMREWLAPAMRERNERIARLAMERGASCAWIVVTGSRLHERRAWRELLGGRQPLTTYVLETPPEVCVQRIALQTHRPDPSGLRQAVKDWWRRYTPDHMNERQIAA